jgi:hypothetical protein
MYVCMYMYVCTLVYVCTSVSSFVGNEIIKTTNTLSFSGASTIGATLYSSGESAAL